MDCSPPGFSVRGISQVRILEWVAFPFPGDLPDPGIEGSPALAGRFFTSEHQGSPFECYKQPTAGLIFTDNWDMWLASVLVKSPTKK